MRHCLARYVRLFCFLLLLNFARSSPLLAQPSAPAAGKERVVVAAVQVSGYDKTDARRADFDPTEQLLPYIDRGARDGAELVVFPEYVLGWIKVPGPETDRLAAAAAKHRLYVIVGCWEDLGEEFRNTALLFDRQGKIAGKYHKTHAAVDHYEGEPAWTRPPAGKDREWFLRNDPEWIMQRGEELPVFELDFGRIGILTCYDGRFPEPFRVLSLKGAELIVWINGRRGSVEDFVVRSVAFTNHTAVVATNQAYGAGTMIVDAPAKIVARSPDREESYIVGELNLGNVRRLRQQSRNFAQRRPDLYGELLSPPRQATEDATEK